MLIGLLGWCLGIGSWGGSSKMVEGKIIVVDEEDGVVGVELRSVVDEKKLWYRVSALWLKNSKGEVLLARRAYTKRHYPGRWGPAVAGTVDEGESYEENIVKEAEEELGLVGADIKEGPKVKISGKYNHFTQWFVGEIDEPVDFFKIQEEEVAEVKWFSVDELKDMIENHPDEVIESLQRLPEGLI